VEDLKLEDDDNTQRARFLLHCRDTNEDHPYAYDHGPQFELYVLISPDIREDNPLDRTALDFSVFRTVQIPLSEAERRNELEHLRA
jgi:hypothetical protein